MKGNKFLFEALELFFFRPNGCWVLFSCRKLSLCFSSLDALVFVFVLRSFNRP